MWFDQLILRMRVQCVSSWDEWVPESRVLKYVDSNLQKQKELQKQISEKVRKKHVA